MKSTHRYEIWPETLKPDALWEGVRTFAAERGMPAKDSGYFNLETSASEEILTDSIEEFLKIIKITPTFQVLVSSQEFGKRPGKHLSIYIDIRGGGISISAESPDVDLVAATHAHLTSNFGLRKRHLPLPTPSRATYPQPKIFLGRHFDARSEKTVAPLRHLLYLLGFDVLEGEAYNSRSIPEKVKSRIDQQPIYLAVVTNAESHDWLIAEAAYALGKDKHIILLVEDRAKFNPTILGKDLEQIRFPVELVEKSFTKLLEEFRDLGVRF